MQIFSPCLDLIFFLLIVSFKGKSFIFYWSSTYQLFFYELCFWCCFENFISKPMVTYIFSYAIFWKFYDLTFCINFFFKGIMSVSKLIFLTCVCLIVIVPFIERLYLIELTFLFCQWSVNCILMGLFLGTLLGSFDLITEWWLVFL